MESWPPRRQQSTLTSKHSDYIIPTGWKSGKSEVQIREKRKELGFWKFRKWKNQRQEKYGK